MKQKKNNTGGFNQRNLAELLRTLHKKEVRLLTNYLKLYGSPGVNQVWQVLKMKYPKFSIQDETIRSTARPGKPIAANVYRVLLAELSNHTKSFLAVQAFQQNEMLYMNTLADTLMKRRAQRNYEKVRQQNERLLNNIQQTTVEYYDHLHQYEYIDFQYVTLFDPLKSDDSLQQASTYHDYSFLLKKLRYITLLRSRGRIIKTSSTAYQNEQEFMDYLSTFPLDELPLIKAYYLMVQLFQDPSFDNYQSLKQHLLPIRDQYQKGEVRQLFTLIGNICFWNIQNGHLEFLEERFILSKIMVEEHYLDVLGYFSNNHFRTTLRNAIEARQLVWAQQFLYDKLPVTHPDRRTNLELLGWASLYFAKGDFEKQEAYMVHMQSEDYHFTDYHNELVYKVLRLKTDFALLGEQPQKREKEAFQLHLNRFFRYCKRKANSKAIPLRTIKARENFGLALRLIFNKRYGTKRIQTDLDVQVLEFQPIIELPWLLGVCGEE